MELTIISSGYKVLGDTGVVVTIQVRVHRSRHAVLVPLVSLLPDRIDSSGIGQTLVFSTVINSLGTAYRTCCRLLSLGASQCGVSIDHTQSQTQAQGVGKAKPLVPVALIADVVGADVKLLMVVGLDAVDSLLQHTEHGVVDFLLRVVGDVVGFWFARLYIFFKWHVAVGVGLCQGNEGHVDAGGIEQVLILVGIGVELHGPQQLSVFLAAVYIEVAPAQGTPSVLIEVVGREPCKLRLVVGRVGTVDVVRQVGGSLVVVVIAFVEEVAEDAGCVGQFTLQGYGVFMAHDVVDVDVGIFAVVFNVDDLGARGVVGQFIGVAAHLVEVVAGSHSKDHDEGTDIFNSLGNHNFLIANF